MFFLRKAISPKVYPRPQDTIIEIKSTKNLDWKKITEAAKPLLPVLPSR
jgi:hypothetical protein